MFVTAIAASPLPSCQLRSWLIRRPVVVYLVPHKYKHNWRNLEEAWRAVTLTISNTCEQRIRHGSVPFSCECCKVASYCGRKHQKLSFVWVLAQLAQGVEEEWEGEWRSIRKLKGFWYVLWEHLPYYYTGTTRDPSYYDGLTFVDWLTCSPTT